MDTCARNPKSIQEARQRDRVFRVEEKHASICFQAASAAEFALGRKERKTTGGAMAVYPWICLQHVELCSCIFGTVLMLLLCVMSYFYSKSLIESFLRAKHGCQ